jgi:hypothetical protein
MDLRERLDSILQDPTFSDAERVAHYLHAHLSQREKNWWGSRKAGVDKSIHPNEAWSLGPLSWLRLFHFKGVRQDPQDGLIGWLEDRYRLQLRADIPSPLEMLNAQCEGLRYVTLLPRWENQFVPYGRHAGALEFTLHDLEHAQKFFATTELQVGQQRFFCRLRNCLDQLLQLDASQEFVTALEYLMADMNSHPLHLVKYLKATLLNVFARSNRRQDYEAYCAELFAGWGFDHEQLISLQRINAPGQESNQDQRSVATFFLPTF